MSLRLLAADGSLAAWTPASPPKALVFSEDEGAPPAAAARLRAAAASVRGALAFLGFEPVAGTAKRADMRLTTRPGPGARVIVPAPPDEAADFASRGFSSDDFRYYCLQTHLRRPMSFSWEGLSAARADMGSLRAASRSLTGVSLEPSSRGVTGYLHRFREALSRDLDFPEALACVWDALRPGALSPGSRAAFLRAALPALGLSEASPDGS